MSDYRVKLVSNVSYPFSAHGSTCRLLTYRQIREAVKRITDAGYIETVHGAGYDWDAMHGRFRHFRYAFEYATPTFRASYVMFIERVQDTCYCETCTDRAAWRSQDA